MSSRLRSLLPVILLALVALGLLVRAHHRAEAPAAAMQHEPQLMLWAWETPEDFTTLDPQRTGVAFLAREVLLGDNPGPDLTIRPRRQPLRVASGTWLMAVVRVETAANFSPTTDLAHRTAQAIAQAAQLSNVRAVQVDFDATAAQRDFYAAMLRDLRAELPAPYPLSITALVSWCGPHSWLNAAQHSSDIDEGVPMFFRMGGPAATRATAPRSQNAIAEPLCSGAVGLSTDEVWPAIRANQRVYLFQSGPWTQNDLARINRFGYQGLRGSARL